MNHIFLKPKIITKKKVKYGGKWVWMEYEETIQP